MHRWDDEALREFQRRIEGGATLAELSEYYGISKSAIRYVINEYGVNGYHKQRDDWQREWTTKQQNELLRDYEGGMPMDDICRKWKMTPWFVYRRISNMKAAGGIHSHMRTLNKRKRRCKYYENRS